MIAFTNSAGNFLVFQFRHQFPLFFLLFLGRFPVICKFQGDVFADLSRFQVWTRFIALFSAEFGPCFPCCDGRSHRLLLEDSADSTSRADFSARGGVDAVRDDGFYARGGVGGDLDGGEFVFFFVGPVCSGTRRVRRWDQVVRGAVRCCCCCHGVLLYMCAWEKKFSRSGLHFLNIEQSNFDYDWPKIFCHLPICPPISDRGAQRSNWGILLCTDSSCFTRFPFSFSVSSVLLVVPSSLPLIPPASHRIPSLVLPLSYVVTRP